MLSSSSVAQTQGMPAAIRLSNWSGVQSQVKHFTVGRPVVGFVGASGSRSTSHSSVRHLKTQPGPKPRRFALATAPRTFAGSCAVARASALIGFNPNERRSAADFSASSSMLTCLSFVESFQPCSSQASYFLGPIPGPFSRSPVRASGSDPLPSFSLREPVALIEENFDSGFDPLLPARHSRPSSGGQGMPKSLRFTFAILPSG